jgi:soluble lytic murein transglycosylase-like protein
MGLSAAVWAAVSIFPTSLADERPEEPELVRDEPAPEGPLAEMARRIELHLADRLPELTGAERSRLAATVVLEADAARIDPLLVLALIEVESSFDPEATSVAGARGLMQLRDATLLRELERQGISGDPRDPAVNVQAGVRYLRRLLDAFRGEDVALMAYNAGPNRILGYLREGGIPDRFQVYPRRVRTELRRLRRAVPAPAAKLAVAEQPVR